MFKNLFLSGVFAIFLTPLLMSQSQTGYVDGEFLVMLDANSEPQRIAADLAVINGKNSSLEFKKLLSDPMRTWLVTCNTNSLKQNDVYRALISHPDVLIVQYNHYVTLRAVPDDPLYGEQWQYNNDGSGGGVAGADIEAEPAWEITTGGLTTQNDTIVVAVLDNGIDTDHEDWGDNIWINHAEIPGNGIDDDNNGYVDDYYGWNISSEDDNIEGGSHGTPVAGIVGAQGNNGIGVTGVNWDVKVMIIKNDFNTTESNVIEAYTYPLVMRQRYNNSGGSEGAFVVSTNASWGIDGGQPEDAPIWCAFYDTLGTYGILSCGATTNVGVNVDEVGDLPTACPSDYLISVTNMNNQDIKVEYAGYGLETIDLGAFGQGTFTLANGNGYNGFGGTSGATPHVTSAIALLYSAPCNYLIDIAKQDPAAAALIVKNAILNGTEPNESLEGITVTGGRLNIYTALLEIINNCPEGECFPPYALQVVQLDSTDYMLQWQYPVDTVNFNVMIKPVDDTTWTIFENYAYDTLVVEQLQACTEYEFKVQTICSDTSSSDYSVSFVFTTDGCCEAPGFNSATDITASSVTLVWEPVLAALSYQVSVFNDDIEFTVETNDTQMTLISLDSCTEYAYYISVICAEGETIQGDTSYFKTKGCGACTDFEYCESQGEVTDFEWIESVTIGDYFNSTGSDEGYAFFDETDIVFGSGTEVEIELEPGFASTEYEEYFMIFLDINQNGIFENDEIVFDPGSAQSQTVTGTILFPENMPEGVTRMRIVMQWNTMPNSCDVFDYGETEDYCVTIDNTIGIAEFDRQNPALKIRPNPADGYFDIHLPDNGNSRLQVFDINGKLVYTGQHASGTIRIDVSAWKPGIYNILLDNGAKRKSARLVIAR